MSKYLKNDYRKFYIYEMYDKNNNLLYIGKTINIHHRINQHFGLEWLVKQNWKVNVYKIIYFELESKVDMDMTELYLIATKKPKYNKQSTDTILPKIEINFSKLNEKCIYYKNQKEESVLHITDKEKNKISNNIILYNGKLNKFREKEINITKSWLNIRKDNISLLNENIKKYIDVNIDDTIIIAMKNIKIYNKNKSYNIAYNYNDLNKFSNYENIIIVSSEDNKKDILEMCKIIKHITLNLNKKIHLYIPSKKLREYLIFWLGDLSLEKIRKSKEHNQIESYVKHMINKPLYDIEKENFIEKINLRDSRNRLQKSYSKINEYLENNYNLHIEKSRPRINGKQVRVWTILEN